MKLHIRRFFSVLWITALMGACRFYPFVPATPSQSPLPESSPVPAVAKIFTPQSGIYRLTAAQLARLDFAHLLDQPDKIILTHRGVNQSFWLEGQGEDASLWFYAQPVNSRYIQENVYLLSSQPLARLGQASPNGPESGQAPDALAGQLSLELPAGATGSLSRLEENKIYLPQASGADRWYWLSLAAPNVAEQAVEIDPFLIPEATGILRVAVWSGTNAATAPDHHLKLALNGVEIADEIWDGAGFHILETQVPGGILSAGQNRVELIAPGDLGLAAEIYHLDWIEVEFPRWAHAIEDRLDFESTGEELVLEGFSGSVHVFEITDPDSAQRLDQSLENGESFTGLAGRRYVLVGPAGILQPSRVELAQFSPNLADPGIVADYLALGPRDLLQPLAPLLELRMDQGLTPLSVPWEAVVDQFNYGLSEPQGIQAFIQYTARAWKQPPKYLLLVGDSTFDPLGYTGETEGNRLPASLVETVYGGETVSDVPLIQLDDDPLPDLAMGIIPARNAEQVAQFVEKTIQYERVHAAGGSSSSVVAIADGQELAFQRDAQSFLDLFPGNVSTDLYAPPPGESGSSQVIKGYLEDQQAMVAYFGHGSINMWGKDRLFTAEDVAALRHSSQPPIVLNLTCLTGLYTHPTEESLAEALLWSPLSGAVAILAPSSLTLPSDQGFLSRFLVEALLEDPGSTLGQAHLAARRAVPVDTAGTLDVMQTFMLFGDPALSVPLLLSQ